MSRVHPSTPQLLENVRIIELATVIAAPSACAILSDHGANVIKIEIKLDRQKDQKEKSANIQMLLGKQFFLC